MIIYEARCTKCGDTFNPQPSNPYNPDEPHFTEADLEHGDCGGRGELMGRWHG